MISLLIGMMLASQVDDLKIFSCTLMENVMVEAYANGDKTLAIDTYVKYIRNCRKRGNQIEHDIDLDITRPL